MSDNSFYNLIDVFNDKTKLYKVDFRVFDKRYNSNLFFNRNLNQNKISELLDVLKESYNIVWTCHSLFDLKSNKKFILDGQHRHAAICEYNKLNIDFQNIKYIYMWEYEINDIYNDNINKFAVDLFKKLNNNTPLSIDDIPKHKAIELLAILKTHKLLKNGISFDERHKTCHSPKIHEKELFELLNKHLYLYESINNDIIVENLCKINHYLSQKSSNELYKNKKITEKEQKIIYKAHEYVFYLGIKDCFYCPKYWIKYITNPTDI